jgi:superfamily II DNA helicase RecQ
MKATAFPVSATKSLSRVMTVHCAVAEWGHDFRSSYRSLHLLREQFPEVPIVAFTATATVPSPSALLSGCSPTRCCVDWQPLVQKDVIAHLHLARPLIVNTSFDRGNLFYAGEPARSA